MINIKFSYPKVLSLLNPIFLAILNLLCQLYINNVYIKSIIVLPLLFFSLAYQIIKVLLKQQVFSGAEYGLLILGINLVATISIGLILEFMGLALNALNWSWAYFICVVFLGSISLLDTWRNGDSKPETVEIRILPKSLFIWGLASLIFISASFIGIYGAISQPREAFSFLWVLPTEIDNQLTIGIQSHEFDAVEFYLEIEMNNTIETIESIILTPDESRLIPVTLDTTQSNADNPITIRLYQRDDPSAIYREVNWYLPN